MALATDQVATGRTGQDGRFDLTVPSPGTYELLAHHPQFGQGTAAAVASSGKPGFTAQIRLDEHGPKVHGRLVDSSTGRPVAATVLLERIDGRRLPPDTGAAFGTRASQDGLLELSLPAGHEYIMRLRAAGYADGTRQVPVRRGIMAADLGTISLEREVALCGRVREQFGPGVPRARVAAFGRDRVAEIASAQTDNGGAFCLPVPGAGAYWVSASAPGFADAARSATTGDPDLVLALVRSGEVVGTIRGRADETGSQYALTACAQDPTEGATGACVPGELVGRRFVIRKLVPGTYDLVVDGPDSGTVSLPGIVVTAGATTNVGELHLPTGGRVEGQVLDTAGRPIPGASVRLRTGRSDRAVETVSDAEGRYWFESIGVGAVELVAAHPQHATARVGELEVSSASTTQADITMTDGGRIEGTVRGRQGSMAGIRVTLVQRSVSASPVFATTDTDGRFSFEHVSPGPALVALMVAPGPGQLLSLDRRDVAIEDEKTAHADLELRSTLVVGAVRQSGSPLPDVRLTFHDPAASNLLLPLDMDVPGDARNWMTTVTDAAGQYDVLVGHPGRFVVSIASADRAASHPPRTVEVPDRDRATLDLDLASTTLAGVVVDSETGGAVAKAKLFAAGPLGAVADAATDDAGGFEMALPPGQYTIEARSDGYLSQSEVVRVPSEGRLELRVAMARGSSIRGKVLTVPGRSSPGTNLSATSSVGGLEYKVTATNLDGSFEVRGLRNEPYNLYAQSSIDGVAIAVGISPGGDPVTLTLQPEAVVVVQVVDPAGAPVPGALVLSMAIGGAPITAIVTPQTGPDGQARLRVPPGFVSVRVEAGARVAERTINVPIGDGEAVRIMLNGKSRK